MFQPNRFVKALFFGGVCTALFACSQPSQDNQQQATNNASADTKTVAITAIIEHPALDNVRKGVIDELAEEGFKEGENLNVNFQSAQGNTATAGQIAKQFVADNPDVIVAIATPSAQSVAASTNTIPIVFSAVTDPVAAKLVPKLDGSGTNVTGASDVLPLDKQIEMIQQIIPKVKNVGFVYSPGEVNSTTVLKNLKEKLTPKGINVIEAPAQRSSDIAMAARSLQGKVDVIFNSADNNVSSAYPALYQASKEMKIPLIASDTLLVEQGATAALGVNYYDLGKETGKIVGRILKGENAGDIPVYTAQSHELYVSPTHAKETGIAIPDEVLAVAVNVDEKVANEQETDSQSTNDGDKTSNQDNAQ